MGFHGRRRVSTRNVFFRSFEAVVVKSGSSRSTQVWKDNLRLFPMLLHQTEEPVIVAHKIVLADSVSPSLPCSPIGDCGVDGAHSQNRLHRHLLLGSCLPPYILDSFSSVPCPMCPRLMIPFVPWDWRSSAIVPIHVRARLWSFVARGGEVIEGDLFRDLKNRLNRDPGNQRTSQTSVGQNRMENRQRLHLAEFWLQA